VGAHEAWPSERLPFRRTIDHIISITPVGLSQVTMPRVLNAAPKNATDDEIVGLLLRDAVSEGVFERELIESTPRLFWAATGESPSSVARSFYSAGAYVREETYDHGVLRLAAYLAGSGVIVACGVAGARCAVAWRRRRDGRCVACGYSLIASVPGSACPECGRHNPRD